MEDRPLTVTITAGTVAKTLVVLAIAALLFAIRDTVLNVLTAVVIASAIEPAVQGLARRKLPRVLAVMLLYLLLLAALVVLFYFFVPSVISDFAALLSSFPKYLDAITRSGPLSQYGSIIGLSGGGASASALLGALAAHGFFGNPFNTIVSVFGGVFSFVVILVFSFYFAVIDTGVDDFLRLLTPRRHQAYVAGLWRRSQHKIGLWMQGQLLLGLIMGLLVFLGLTILGVPNALILAVVSGCFELIPVFGIIFAGGLATAVALASGGLTLGLLTLAFYVIAQQFESNLIYPLVVTRVVGVPPLLVILALIIGGQLAGFLGIILSVPAAATLHELARDWESGRLQRQEGKS